jgi:hypothetical protein
MKTRDKAITGVLILVGLGIFTYYYFFRKPKGVVIEEDPEVLKLREQYKNINNVDEFIIGSKYVKQPSQFGYDLKQMEKYKDKLTKMEFKNLKDIYELLKKPLNQRTEEDNVKVLQFLGALAI